MVMSAYQLVKSRARFCRGLGQSHIEHRMNLFVTNTFAMKESTAGVNVSIATGLECAVTAHQHLTEWLSRMCERGSLREVFIREVGG